MRDKAPKRRKAHETRKAHEKKIANKKLRIYWRKKTNKIGKNLVKIKAEKNLQEKEMTEACQDKVVQNLVKVFLLKKVQNRLETNKSGDNHKDCTNKHIKMIMLKTKIHKKLQA